MRRVVSLALAGLLAVMIAAPVQANTVTTTKTVSVPTTASGTTTLGTTPVVDSGINLTSTYSISVTAVSNAAAIAPGNYVTGSAVGTTCINLTTPCTAPDLPAYGIIAKVGSGSWQWVGLGPTTLTGTGEVYFAFNDGKYDDNSGSFTVTITSIFDLPAVTTSCDGITAGTYTGFSLVGQYFVPSNTAAATEGPEFTYGAQYKVESQGVYQFGSNPTWLAEADWLYGRDGPFWEQSISGLPPYDLNLLINGNGFEWGAYNPAHTYTHDLIGTGSPAHFGLSILDAYGGSTFYGDNTGGLCVSVFKDDMAPTVSSVSLPSSPAPSPVTLTATASDSTTGDSFIASAQYSLDGGTNWTGSMTASDGSFDSATENVTASITTPGVYNVCVKATDAAGNTSQPTCASEPLVVYDPSAGFVTGGGRDGINNNFGFVAKYQAGGSVPVGSLEYQNELGNFHSNSFTYLVVAGNTAILGGTGTLNGVSGYSFTLTVTDTPDQFQIFFSGNTLDGYSSGSLAPISKGSIQIHS